MGSPTTRSSFGAGFVETETNCRPSLADRAPPVWTVRRVRMDRKAPIGDHRDRNAALPLNPRTRTFSGEAATAPRIERWFVDGVGG
jgi:hypothetical protein